MAATSKPTQDFVPIKEVRDGIVILEDGSMRMLLMTSSVNFALKSVNEQQAIIFQFQNFLNTLDFPIQIFIQSRRLDIRPYLNLLEDRRKIQTNDLMKIQTKEYIGFIRTFTDSIDIMTKNFFIVVPYTPPKIDIKKSRFFGGKKKKNPNKAEVFEEQKIQLDQRVSIVEQGITRTGVRTARLGTEEIIEVFYKIFNPGDIDKSVKFEQI